MEGDNAIPDILLISLFHEVLLTFDRYNLSLLQLAFLLSTSRNLHMAQHANYLSPLVLSVASGVLPVPVLILMTVRFFCLGLRLGVASGDLMFTAFGDDDYGGAVVAGLRARNTWGRRGRRRRCSTVSVILHEERTSLSCIRSTMHTDLVRREGRIK